MSLPRYPGYKESGVAWLGQVPAHWEVQSLSRITEDKCDGPFGSGLKSSHYTDTGIRVLRLQNIRKEGFDGTDAAYIDENYYRTELHGHDVRKDDVLIAGLGDERNTVGRACVAPVGIEPAMVKADCFRFRIFPAQALPEFVSFQLNAGSACDAGMLSSGSTRSRIPLSIMASRKIALPPIEEQRSILTFLNGETAKIDALIAEQEKLLTLLAEKRQAAISHAVTRGLNPSASMKDSGIPWLGEVPAHWDVCPLKYISRLGNGSTPNRDNPDYWDESGFPWLNSSVVNQDEVTEAERFVTELALKECHLPVVQPPAVLVGITGQGKTRGMAAPLMFEATINQHLAYIKPESGRLQVAYLLRALEMAYEHLRTDSEGAGSTKGAITCDQLSRFAIPLPPLDEQDAIASHLDVQAAQFDRLAEDSRRAIALLKERRSALIAAAVTGKIDVRVHS